MLKSWACSLLCIGLSLFPIRAANSAELDALQGKWSVTKTNAEGQRVKLNLEIKQNRMIFQLLGEDDQVRFTAKGAIKAEKAGPFDILVISDMEGGRSADDLKPVDDTRTLVYTLRDEKLITASNFDKDRNSEKPSVEYYSRVEAAKESASAGEETKLLGTWKAEVTFGDRTIDYSLRIANTDGKLVATWISPRSGDHPCKSTVYKNGELTMELNREIQGNDVTLVYKGKLAAEELSGTITAKGYEDQYSGKWKASQ